MNSPTAGSVITMALVMIIFLFLLLLSSRDYRELQNEAVKRGYAEYVVVQGDAARPCVTFKWKEPKKECEKKDTP